MQWGAGHVTDTEAMRLTGRGQGRQETGVRNTPSHVQPGGEREGGNTFCPEEEPVLGPRTEEGAMGQRTGQRGGGLLPGTIASFCKWQRATLQANKGRGLNYSQACPVMKRPGLEGSSPRAPSLCPPESLRIAYCPLGSMRPRPCCPFGHCPLATRSVHHTRFLVFIALSAPEDERRVTCLAIRSHPLRPSSLWSDQPTTGPARLMEGTHGNDLFLGEISPGMSRVAPTALSFSPESRGQQSRPSEKHVSHATAPLPPLALGIKSSTFHMMKTPLTP